LRIVFDTNVYISAFVVQRSKSELAFTLAARGLFELLVSPEILAELQGKLSTRFGYSPETVEEVGREVREVAAMVEPELRLSVLEDEPDNRILECAVAAGAMAIVTGDKDLLALKNYEGIGIMTVSDLLYTFPG
jgi:putative PIN family toxin of toxin-antitoxin system